MKNRKWICGLCVLFLLFSSTSVLAAQVTFDGNMGEDTEETETIEETEVAENTETVEEGTEIEK